MKTKLTALAGLAFMVAGLAINQVSAQETHNTDRPANTEQKQQRPRGGMMNIDRLKEALSLTDEQVAKVEPLLKENMDAMRALRDSGVAREEMRAKAMALRAEFNKKLEAILTPEQIKKLHEMGPGNRQRGAEGQGGENRPPRGNN